MICAVSYFYDQVESEGVCAPLVNHVPGGEISPPDILEHLQEIQGMRSRKGHQMQINDDSS